MCQIPVLFAVFRFALSLDVFGPRPAHGSVMRRCHWEWAPDGSV